MANPAMARAFPKTTELASLFPKRSLVRYTVKTKVVMTALIAADPQSQAAHAMTGLVIIFRWSAEASDATGISLMGES